MVLQVRQESKYYAQLLLSPQTGHVRSSTQMNGKRVL
jgi:hypothetical protein